MSIQKFFPLRTKFYCGCLGITSIKRSYSSPSNIEVLSNLTGISYKEAKQYAIENVLLEDTYLLEKNIKFCQKLGYSIERILTIRKFLAKHPNELQQHYLSMEEGGFFPISPEVLANFQIIMRHSVKLLKRKKIIQKDIHIVKKMVSYIENEEIRSSIPLDYREEDSWTNIHLNVVRAFLKMRMNVTQDQLTRMFETHRTVKNKSLRVLEENIKLAEELGFSHEKILKCGYILSNFPDYTKATLREYPTLVGQDMRKSMLAFPKLMMTPPRKIDQMYKILKDHDIPDSIIARQLNIFYMSCKTIEERLKEIKGIPDLRIFFNHPDFLRLVVYFNKTKSRLNFLKQMPIKCRSPSLLQSGSDESFEDYLREGKDVNKVCDVLGFLRTIFPDDLEQIHNQLKRHPKYLQVPLKEMMATYDFLKDKHYNDSSIIKVIWILLYPMEKVENALVKILCDQYRFFDEVTKLNMILYFIERDHHFTGNGIWSHQFIEDAIEMTCQ